MPRVLNFVKSRFLLQFQTFRHNSAFRFGLTLKAKATCPPTMLCIHALSVLRHEPTPDPRSRSGKRQPICALLSGSVSTGPERPGNPLAPRRSHRQRGPKRLDYSGNPANPLPFSCKWSKIRPVSIEARPQDVVYLYRDTWKLAKVSCRRAALRVAPPPPLLFLGRCSPSKQAKGCKFIDKTIRSPRAILPAQAWLLTPPSHHQSTEPHSNSRHSHLSAPELPSGWPADSFREP